MAITRQKFSNSELQTFLRDFESVKLLLDETPLFDSGYYLSQNPDVIESEHTPVEHFALYGSKEHRQPHPLFDPKHYTSQLNPEKLEPGLEDNLLIHYLLSNDAKFLCPHPLFDARYYLTQRISSLLDSKTALEDFLTAPVGDQVDPHPFFSIRSVRSNCPPLVASAENPLVFYLKNIHTWGICTHPQFDGSWYLEHNPDVKAANLNPLLHFVTHGQKEARSSSPLRSSEVSDLEKTFGKGFERIIDQFIRASDREPVLPKFVTESSFAKQHTPGRKALKRSSQLQLLRLAQGRSIESVLFLPNAKLFRSSPLPAKKFCSSSTLIISETHDREFQQLFGRDILTFSLSEIFHNTHTQDTIEALRLLLLIHRPKLTFFFALSIAWELLKQYGPALTQMTESCAFLSPILEVDREISGLTLLSETLPSLHSVIVLSQDEKELISRKLGLLPEDNRKLCLWDRVGDASNNSLRATKLTCFQQEQ